MKKLLLIGFAVLVANPGLLAAREWSKQQQEVVDHMIICWEAWAKNPADHDAWVKACRPTDDMLWWTSSETLPQDKASNRRVEMGIGKYVDEVLWWDIRIHEVTVIDNVAIIYFTGQTEVTFTGGRDPFRGESRRCEIFRKVEGKWRFQGGMITPVGDQW